MGIKVIEKNKKAGFDYFLIEKFEAGMVLTGTEVKSLRNGKVSIKEAYISIDDNFEAWAYNINIPNYEFGNINNHKEDRKRKLLLNSSELRTLFHRSQAERLTIVPTMIYFKDDKIKLEIALAKGKKLYDKRDDKAKKDTDRKLQRGIFD